MEHTIFTQQSENDVDQPRKLGLRPKQKRFCEFYSIDFNTVQAYKRAYGEDTKDHVCRANASRLLTKDSIKAYLKELAADLEKTVGISRTKVLLELKKIAFSSIAHLHNTWIERKDFEKLTSEQKDCIAEIQTQVRTVIEDERPVQIEFIKVKLYDKQKAIDSIIKMLGYSNESELPASAPAVTGIQILIDDRKTEITTEANPGGQVLG